MMLSDIFSQTLRRIAVFLRHLNITKEIYILFLAAILTLATMYIPQPLLSTIQKDFSSLNNAQIALFMTVVFAPLSIAPLIYGTLLSAFSTKRILQYSVTILFFASIGIYCSSDFENILFFRSVQGLIVPAMLTSLMAYLSEHYSGPHLQQILATYIAATILGGLMGRIFAGIIADFFTWQSSFLALAMALALLLALLTTLKEQPAHLSKKISVGEFNHILHTKGIKRLLFIEAICFFVFVALATYLPFFLTHIDENISESRIALTYLGYGIGIVIALKSRTIIARVGGSVKSIRLGIFTFALSLLFFLVPNVYCIFFAMFLLCAGQFLEHSITPGLVNRICPYNKSAVNGLYLSIYYIGGALGSYVPGFIYEKYGWYTFIMVLGVMLLTAFMASFGLEKHTPQQ